jgi:hypothetical protein
MHLLSLDALLGALVVVELLLVRPVLVNLLLELAVDGADGGTVLLDLACIRYIRHRGTVLLDLACIRYIRYTDTSQNGGTVLLDLACIRYIRYTHTSQSSNPAPRTLNSTP